MATQPNMFDWAEREDAQALAEGRSIFIVRKPATAARTATVCYGGHIPEHCHCPQPGAPKSTKRAKASRKAVYRAPAAAPETLPRARQAPVDMSATTLASLSPERAALRVGLARHVEAGR
jgi:hypothetical protein